jgi:two-component system sensor histidine kinase MtrB
VLGLVLQTQIAQRLLQAKEADARVRTETGAVLLEGDLAGVDPDREGAQGELNNALDRLTNASSAEDQPATAGEFRAVLSTSVGDPGAQVAAGPVEDVPATLREAVAAGTLSNQYTTTFTEQGVEVPTLVVGSRCARPSVTWSSTCCSRSPPSNARSGRCRAR